MVHPACDLEVSHHRHHSSVTLCCCEALCGPEKFVIYIPCMKLPLAITISTRRTAALNLCQRSQIQRGVNGTYLRNANRSRVAGAAASRHSCNSCRAFFEGSRTLIPCQDRNCSTYRTARWRWHTAPRGVPGSAPGRRRTRCTATHWRPPPTTPRSLPGPDGNRCSWHPPHCLARPGHRSMFRSDRGNHFFCSPGSKLSWGDFHVCCVCLPASVSISGTVLLWVKPTPLFCKVCEAGTRKLCSWGSMCA